MALVMAAAGTRWNRTTWLRCEDDGGPAPPQREGWSRWSVGNRAGRQQQRGAPSHLKTLKDAGFVVDRREGRWIYYGLNPETLVALREVVSVLGAPGVGGLRVVSRRCE